MKKKGISLFLCCLACVFCRAQTEGYNFYCLLDSIKTPGFYSIKISPELSAYLKTDYSDLRIINNSGKWVPHILHLPENERSDLTLAIELKFSKTETEKSNTNLIMEAGIEPMSNVGIVINNTAAERFCSLSGSDDPKNWFVINDSILINPGSSVSGTTNTFRIDFPPSSYRYYKIVISNNGKDPFDIKSIVQNVAASKLTNSAIELIQNPPTIIDQKDNGKISYIKITQQKPYHFNVISMKVSGPKYFFKNVGVYLPVDTVHSYMNPGNLFHSFTISNNSTLQFRLPLINTREFYLLIHNEDNLPLKVGEVKTAVNSHNITAYLDKGNDYKLIMGNTSAVSPAYDLARQDTPVPARTTFLNFGKVMAMENNKAAAIPVKNNKPILWTAIIISLLVLLFFTLRMTREIDKRKQDDSI